jgi:uncharacterized protein (TIGR03000 family)
MNANLILFVFSAGLVALGGNAQALPARTRALAAERPELQATASRQRSSTSRIVVTLPAEDAELEVNGKPIAGEGSSRAFTGPVAGGTQRYTFTVKWKPNGYTTMTRTKVVAIRGGQTVQVDLTVDDPADRVRVIYVATPEDVAAAMVDLARVGPDDVVYEPGCGDARITIAAIRAGARRGICVDIDPKQARDSKANVAKAGFADRIDVREGDALDVKNLSNVSVVFLYMGDHFNLLIRPVLWRELKVGSRIVSHRFTMGDWKPDRTISVSSDLTGFSELHLWTITEEIKRSLTSQGRARP